MLESLGMMLADERIHALWIRRLDLVEARSCSKRFS